MHAIFDVTHILFPPLLQKAIFIHLLQSFYFSTHHFYPLYFIFFNLTPVFVIINIFLLYVKLFMTYFRHTYIFLCYSQIFTSFFYKTKKMSLSQRHFSRIPRHSILFFVIMLIFLRLFCALCLHLSFHVWLPYIPSVQIEQYPD